MANARIADNTSPVSHYSRQVLVSAGGQYLLRMSSLVLVDLVLTGFFLLLSQRPNLFIPDALLNFAVFCVLNMIGCLVLSRDLFGRNMEPNVEDLGKIINRLPTLSAIWAAILTAIYTGVAFSWNIFLPASAPFDQMPEMTQLILPIWFSLLYVASYSFYTRFLIEDLCQDLKLKLFSHGITLPPSPGRFIYLLTACLFICSIAPVALVTSDITVFREFREMQGLDLPRTIFLDLLAAGFLVTITTVFIIRSVNRPLNHLSESMAALRKDDLSIRAPVLTNDDFGQLATSFNDLVHNSEKRKILQNTLGQHIPDDLAPLLLDDNRFAQPQHGDGTVLFVNIVDFTTLAERYPADRIINMLNDFFAASETIIRSHFGIVTQLQGDSVLACFNLPIQDQKHAHHAIEAALDLMALARNRQFMGIAVNLRIGIASGPIMAGSVGGSEKRQFGIYGHVVNLASRLEQHNKETGTRILVDEKTRGYCKDAFTFQDHGVIQFHSLFGAIQVYAVHSGDNSLQNPDDQA